ncbi:acyltransferase domain-containing protein [Streptomyces bacillaris]
MSDTATGNPPEEITGEGLSPVLLFPGQGAQYPGMGTGLYRAEPQFAAAVDEVFAAMGPNGAELRTDWLSEAPVLPLVHVTRSQPLLFTLGHALGRVLLDRGLRPAALLGHSIGEVVAASLAGVFGLESAVRLVIDRVTRLASVPAGGMVAVSATVEETTARLRPEVEVGAVNAPRQTVISGPAEPLAATVEALRTDGFVCAPVASLTPFHSSALREVVSTGLESLAGRELCPPSIPIVSGYTAAPLKDEEATDPRYWARHPVAPVLFWPALESLLSRGPHLLAECGPGQGLVTLARRHPDVRAGRSTGLALLGPSGDPGEEVRHFRTACARLSLAGP